VSAQDKAGSQGPAPEARTPQDPPAAKSRDPGTDSSVLSLEDRKKLRQADAERVAAARREKQQEKLRELERFDEEDDQSRGKARPGGGGQRGGGQDKGGQPGQGQGQGQGQGKARPAQVRVAPPVGARRIRGRHWFASVLFVAMGVVPVGIAGWYLWERAADRYVSVAGFSVRKEEGLGGADLLGGLASIAGTSSSSDTDILYRFIQSQDMVARVDARLDLRGIWAKVDPEIDPIFAYHPPGTIEDLTDYWNRMVSVYNDSSGLMDLEVQAFTPEDAQTIAEVIYDESSKMINLLAATAQADTTRFSREELDRAVEQLKEARAAVTLFRNRNQIVDPQASVQSQMGLLSSLQTQLAATLIDLDILKQTTAESDPRIVAAERRVEVIEARIQEERDKLGMGARSGDGVQDDAFATLLGEYERLQVDLKFAEEAYIAALASFDAAVAQTRKQSRYLASHVQPTLPERSDQPDRTTLLGLVALFAFLSWSILVLVAYALKDRR